MDMKASAARALSTGRGLYEFATRLYPICRSITGAGVRQTRIAFIHPRATGGVLTEIVEAAP